MIVVEYQQKTENAFESKSFEQLRLSIYRYCLSLTGSHWDAEDLAQETWLKAAGSFKRKNHTNYEAFLIRIAKNIWIDQLRRKTLLKQILQQKHNKETTLALENGLLELEAIFQALILHLSPLQRTVFLMRDVMGHSIAETAEILKTTKGAVKAALNRARRSLQLVREDLAESKLSLPKEDNVKAYLKALASAYQMGDMMQLIVLAQQEQIEPVTVLSIAYNQLLDRSRSNRHAEDSQSIIRMAA